MNLKRLLGLVATPPTADEPSAAIRDRLAELDLPALERAADDLERERRSALLTASDADLAKLDDRIAAAERAVERGHAIKAELESRLAAAKEREAAATLDGRRKRAEQLTKAAVAALDRDLRDAYARVRAVIRSVEEAEAAVDAVNRDLPADQRLPGPEEWRNRPRYQPAFDLRREPVRRWTTERGDIVSDADAATVVVSRDNPDAGTIPSLPVARGMLAPPAVPVIARQFLRVERLPQVIGDGVPRLADIFLQPIRAGEAAGWSRQDATWVPCEADAPTVLEALDQVDAAALAVRKPADHRRPVVLYEPVPAAPTAKAA